MKEIINPPKLKPIEIHSDVGVFVVFENPKGEQQIMPKNPITYFEWEKEMAGRDRK